MNSVWRCLRVPASWLLGIVGICLLAACGGGYEAPLRVGVNNWPGYGTLLYARDLGAYDGAPVRLVELASSTQVMDALKVGKLDAAGLTLDEVLKLVHDGVPLSIVWAMDVSAGADALLVRPEITQLSDLVGKRIGVEQTALGAYMLDAALRAGGLKAWDVDVVPMPIDEHVDAFVQRKVDAVVSFEPVIQQLRSADARIVFDSRSIPGEIVDVLAVRRDVLECCEDRVRRLLKGQIEAMRRLRETPQHAIVAMTPRSGLTEDEFQAALDGLIIPDVEANAALLDGASASLGATVERLADIMLERGLLVRPPEVSGLLDGRFVRIEGRAR